jgi:hypothetical protein
MIWAQLHKKYHNKINIKIFFFIMTLNIKV